MTVRFHPPENPSAFADLLVTLLARAALAGAAGGGNAAEDASGGTAPEAQRREAVSP